MTNEPKLDERLRAQDEVLRLLTCELQNRKAFLFGLPDLLWRAFGHRLVPSSGIYLPPETVQRGTHIAVDVRQGPADELLTSLLEAGARVTIVCLWGQLDGLRTRFGRRVAYLTGRASPAIRLAARLLGLLGYPMPPTGERARMTLVHLAEELAVDLVHCVGDVLPAFDVRVPIVLHVPGGPPNPNEARRRLSAGLAAAIVGPGTVDFEAIKDTYRRVLGREPVFGTGATARPASPPVLVIRHRLILRNLLGFKLGWLDQSPPRPMRVPARYHSPAGASGRLRVSVVTPVFNQARYIGATLDSVLTQNYPQVEYVVMDGGSTDGTKEIIETRAGRLAAFRSGKDAGQADAINAGMKLTTGSILCWLNGDDLMLPGAIEYVTRYLETHPEVDVIYGHRIVVDGEGKEVGRWVLPPHAPEVLSWVDYIPQETLFWRRKAWEKVGAALDVSFRFAMDWDLLVRMRDAGLCVHRVPRFLGAFRSHPEQKTNLEIGSTGAAEMDRIRMRCLGRIPDKREIYLNIAPYLVSHAILQRLDQVLGWY